MECASSQVQRGGGGEIFLLSELEKVWAATSILLGKLLVEGKNVQVPHFGAFWLEEQHLVTDLHRRRFSTRKLCFGLQRHFATKYGVKVEKVQMESRAVAYAKLPPANIVALCEVPAHRAMLALREFFLYIGEGLFQGRVFELRFPGVATVLLRREQMQLNADWELQMALFDVDAKRWPAEMKAHCQQVLQDIALRGHALPSGRSTARSSGSTARCGSRTSWRSSAPPTPIDPAAVFTPAAPSGRLFSDIEREQARRKEMAAKKKEAEKDLERRLLEMQERQRYVEAAAASLHDRHYPYEADVDVDGRPSTAASGESIYNVLSDVGSERPLHTATHPHYCERYEADRTGLPPSSSGDLSSAGRQRIGHPHSGGPAHHSRHVAFAGMAGEREYKGGAEDCDDDDVNEIIEVTEVTPTSVELPPPPVPSSTAPSMMPLRRGRMGLGLDSHPEQDPTGVPVLSSFAATSSREIGKGIVWQPVQHQDRYGALEHSHASSSPISPPLRHDHHNENSHTGNASSTARHRTLAAGAGEGNVATSSPPHYQYQDPLALSPPSRRSYHDHCSVRELLYDNPAAADPNSIHASERLSAQLHQHRPSTASSTEPVHFGRKRFDVSQSASAELDHVAALLKDQRDMASKAPLHEVEMHNNNNTKRGRR